MPKEEAEALIAEGTLYQGRLRVAGQTHAFVTVEGFRRDVFISGHRDRNRAWPDDIVAIRLKPPSKWRPISERQLKRLAIHLEKQTRQQPQPQQSKAAAQADREDQV
eukprot:GABV01000853.1.p2 GENE.GABV01000853.1~~GABV01000853.1.p2  ORF type:complete len:107 (-),score=33.57 GABV01000853.1:617-937(-)